MPIMKGHTLYVKLLADQRRWIEQCEASGRSYAGPNGQQIREADEAELRRIEQRLREYEGRRR